MDRIFKCKIVCTNIPIRIYEQSISIDKELRANIIFECSYRVMFEEDFKKNTNFDITNAIHRSKIEEQLKVFLSNIILNAFTNYEIGKMTYRQIKECDVDIQDEIHTKVQKFYLIKEGLDILEVEMMEIKLSYSDTIEIEEKIKLQNTISEVFDMDTEIKILLPEFIDEEATKKNTPWTCSCGCINRTNFCPNCGAKKEKEINKIVLTL